MVTRKQLEDAFGYGRKAFTLMKDVDHDFVAISLLRKRIPHDECKAIIGGAVHEMIFLCHVDLACKYITEEDIPILADCNVGIDDENDSLRLFV